MPETYHVKIKQHDEKSWKFVMSVLRVTNRKKDALILSKTDALFLMANLRQHDTLSDFKIVPSV